MISISFSVLVWLDPLVFSFWNSNAVYTCCFNYTSTIESQRHSYPKVSPAHLRRSFISAYTFEGGEDEPRFTDWLVAVATNGNY